MQHPITVAPEPAITLLRRRAGYRLLSADRGTAKRPALEETGRQAAYCKHTAPGSPSRLTHNSNSYGISLTHTHTLHTLRGLCNGPI